RFPAAHTGSPPPEHPSPARHVRGHHPAPPGSRRVLPPSSPLRTGQEGCPSSGSSPWPLSPVLLMTLPMAPWVDQTFVVDIVCPPVTYGDNMIRFYGLSRDKWDAA